jgi:hypothetical protein
LSGAVDHYAYNERSELIAAGKSNGVGEIRGFSEDFDYDAAGNRLSSSVYDEDGAVVDTVYVANNLNQYISRAIPGIATVRGFAERASDVTVNGNESWRYDEYFYGTAQFDNTNSNLVADIETMAVGQLQEENISGVSAVTNTVFIAKTPDEPQYDADVNQTKSPQRPEYGKWCTMAKIVRCAGSAETRLWI